MMDNASDSWDASFSTSASRPFSATPLFVSPSSLGVVTAIHVNNRSGTLHSNVCCSHRKQLRLFESFRHAIANCRSRSCSALVFASTAERGDKSSSKASWIQDCMYSRSWTSILFLSLRKVRSKLDTRLRPGLIPYGRLFSSVYSRRCGFFSTSSVM